MNLPIGLHLTGAALAASPSGPAKDENGEPWHDDAYHPKFDVCQTKHRADGSTLTIEESHWDVAHKPHTVLHMRIVELWRPDGTTVRSFQDGPVVAAANPGTGLSVTRDQVVALVTGPDILLYLPPQR